MHKKRGFLRFVLDRLCFPVLAFLDYETSKKAGLTPIDEERAYACLKYSKGRVLDIGCGDARFIDTYGDGYGIDRVLAASPRFILADAANMPFKNKVFDTVTLIASLNHIIDRDAALREAVRVLKDDGQVLITMIDPLVGFLAHKIVRRRCDPDQIRRHWEKKELLGLTGSQVSALTSRAGLMIVAIKSVLFCRNRLYICKRRSAPGNSG